VTALVKPNGDVAERYTYDPYGRPTVRHGVVDSAGNDTSGSEWQQRTANTFDNAVLYCGYRYDPETGLYHVRYRPYHPTLGRWLARDTELYVDGANLYLYCDDSPINYLDHYATEKTRTQLEKKIKEHRDEMKKYWNWSRYDKGYYGDDYKSKRRYRHNKKMYEYHRDRAADCADELADLLSEEAKEGDSGSSASFVEDILDGIPITLRAGASYSADFIIFPMPPFGSVEAKVAGSGHVQNCIKDNGDPGLMFEGRIKVNINIGVGTILGGFTNSKLSRRHRGGSHEGKSTIHDTRTGRIKGLAGKDYGEGLGRFVGMQGCVRCPSDITGDITGLLYVEAKLAVIVGSGYARMEAGRCSMKHGCQWTWSLDPGWDWGLTGVGFRVELGAELRGELELPLN
jgi:RHS repeat-associated protein